MRVLEKLLDGAYQATWSVNFHTIKPNKAFSKQGTIQHDTRPGFLQKHGATQLYRENVCDGYVACGEELKQWGRAISVKGILSHETHCDRFCM